MVRILIIYWLVSVCLQHHTQSDNIINWLKTENQIRWMNERRNVLIKTRHANRKCANVKEF